jgi:uncharacterized protein (TIGR02466 family)
MIQNLFSVPVAITTNEKHNEVQDELVDECTKIKKESKQGGSNWQSTVFNTCGTYNVHTNEKFNLITKFVFNSICDFADIVGFKNRQINCDSSWINYYEPGDYQEEHDHITDQLVSVYYLKSNKNSGDIRINGPLIRTMPPLYDKNNPYTWQNFDFTPEPGKLIMFKSDVRHSVGKNKSDETRISLAYNFKVI